MRLPQIDIQSTPIKISTTTTKGKLHVTSTQATPQYNIERGRYDIENGSVEVIFDTTKTREALNGGPHFKFMERMYDQNGQYVIEGIKRRVEQYDQIGDLTNPNNPIPSIAYQNAFVRKLQHQVYGSASVFNTEARADIKAPSIKYIKGVTDTTIAPGKVSMNYECGSIRTQVDQYPSVEVTAK